MSETHPTPRTLELFDIIFQALRTIAEVGDLSEIEDLKLSHLVEALHALHEEYGDRTLLEIFEANDAANDPDIQPAKERVRARLLQALAQSDDENLQELALAAWSGDKTHTC